MFVKTYPYLQNPYYEDVNAETQRRSFLQDIDNFVNQKRYARITLLTWEEEPIKDLSGEIASGDISKDGSSSFRRVCNLTTSVDTNSYNVDDADMDFAVNKKVYLEIGVRNDTDKFKEYPILWFPQGVFFIQSFSCNVSTTSALNISLTLKDKMGMLNGDIGGKFPALTQLDELDTQSEDGATIQKKVPIYQIIQELVHHFGGEDLNNIVIEDVPLRIKRVVKWTGSNPLYLISTPSTEGVQSYIAQVEAVEGIAPKYLGDDVGYVYDDFVWTEELLANAGETVTSALDKIKNGLGNYEYFYDEFGVFHFREIKNFLNTTQATYLENMNDVFTDIKNLDEADISYFADVTTPKSAYTFTDNTNLLSLTNTPMYENIKNDFVVQGQKTIAGSTIKVPIRYHVAIDDRPELNEYGYDNVLIYCEPDSTIQKMCTPQLVNNEGDLPPVGEFNTIYVQSDGTVGWIWAEKEYKNITIIQYYGDNVGQRYFTQNWREELYIQGMKSIPSAIDVNYYFTEMKDNFPRIYSFKEHNWFSALGYEEGEVNEDEVYDSAVLEGTFFIDIIDAKTSNMGEFSVQNIGRRSDVIVDEKINCLFQPEIPDIVFIDTTDMTREELEAARNECNRNGQPYCQVRGDIANALVTGGNKNGAYDKIKYEIFLHTNYQKSISLTALPTYYLEPNVRVTINDSRTNTFGDFIVKNISLPLAVGSTMTVACGETFERF